MSYSVPLAAAVSLRVVNHIPAMIAYWDSSEKCVFSNDAYLVWFGREPSSMIGMSLAQLLGPLYALNLPYIKGALRGERQMFERQIPLPGGEVRDTIATYTPDIIDGVVLGFSAHVADVTAMRQREAALRLAIQETIQILEQTKQSFHSKQLGVLRERLIQMSGALARDHAAARSAEHERKA